MSTKPSSTSSNVFVNAYARLHMGFLDLNGSMGRRFGSLGLVDQEVSIHVHREIPRHFGLGSGTQMALAIGQGINQLFDLNLSLTEIADITNRGNRSGIGIGTFASGGMVLDGGRGKQTGIPPIIAQHTFPEAWRVLLIFDHQHVGVHGEQERSAFASLEDADLQKTQQVYQQVLMHALPALREQNLEAFGQAIASLQIYTGDYFSPIQGGRYASPLVAEVLNYLIDDGVLCAGQSSWGPTGFAVFETQTIAEQYLRKLKSQFTAQSLGWLLCGASNVGATVNQ